jgi:hypothetical protein
MQGWRFAIVGALGRLLCSRDSHYDMPVAIRTMQPRRVLLRCDRCGRELVLEGEAADQWLHRWRHR